MTERHPRYHGAFAPFGQYTVNNDFKNSVGQIFNAMSMKCEDVWATLDLGPNDMYLGY